MNSACARTASLPSRTSAPLDDEYECIDLSHNALTRLDNFPLLPRLTTLIAHHNTIRRITPTLATTLPHLTHLALAHNSLAQHTDLAPLSRLARLVWLDVSGCPLTRVAEYRLRVLHVLPRLVVLDYNKVKTKEREASVARYGTYVAEDEERKDVSGGGVGGGVVAMVEDERKDVVADKRLTDKDMAAHMAQLIDRIQQATSLEEITALEQQLAALSQEQR